MKKIILLISLLTVTLNASPALANQHSKFELKQTNNILKNPHTKRTITKDIASW